MANLPAFKVAIVHAAPAFLDLTATVDKACSLIREALATVPPWWRSPKLMFPRFQCGSLYGHFQFDVQGQVAKCIHAGIPWLYRIRQAVGKKVHFWPFDGWEIRRGRSVIAEVFPAILRRRYPREDRTVDQHDAYAIARWLKDVGWGRTLADVYLDPVLTGRDRDIAEREGWILGVL